MEGELTLLEAKLQAYYCRVGKNLLKFADDTQGDINDLVDEIICKKRALSEAKNEIQCIKCTVLNSSDSIYCKRCGSKLIENNDKESANETR